MRCRNIDKAKKQYTQIRNEVNKSLKLARKSYYEGRFNQAESSKDYWRVFKEFKGNSNTITSNSIVVSEDCRNMSLCNYILNFFGEKIRNIKSSIRGIASGTNPNFLTHKIMKDKSDVPVFELRAPTISETRKAIMKLKDGSEGPDGISSTLLKIACTNFKFLKTVHFLFYVSIITNKTADVWKISQIRALYKGNHKNPNSVSNYRPVSPV